RAARRERHTTMSDTELDVDDAPKGPPPGVKGMSVVRWLLILAMAGAALASVLHYTGVLDKLFARSSGDGTKTEYYCPMHPSVVQDHPGECPICSMTLVPKTQGAAAPMADAGMAAAPV